MLEHGAPARRVSESTVSENDCRLGHELPFAEGTVGHSLRSSLRDRARGLPWSDARVCDQGFSRTRCSLPTRNHWLNLNLLEDQMVILRQKMRSKHDKIDEVTAALAAIIA